MYDSIYTKLSERPNSICSDKKQIGGAWGWAGGGRAFWGRAEGNSGVMEVFHFLTVVGIACVYVSVKTHQI